MKILSARQIRQADHYTIEHEPVASIDLMERASVAFTNWFALKFPLPQPSVHVLCGKGNNGGDGLAIARLLSERGYSVNVYIIEAFERSTPDFKTNLQRLSTLAHVPVRSVQTADDLPVFGAEELLIDAIVGSGLQAPLQGVLKGLVEYINECGNRVIAVDLPTGLNGDGPTEGVCIYAQYTFSFETPRLAFFFAENYHRVGEFAYASIGLDANFIQNQSTPYHYIDQSLITSFLKKREKFAHKGVFGHALLIAGSYGKMGAAILATKACLRVGVGLATVHIPTCGYDVMQTAVPEAMVSLDEDPYIFTRVYDLYKYSVLAIGCGLSTKNKTRNALCYVLKNIETPTILDADALNILAQSPDWLEYIPPGSILTPHAKEFERLFGKIERDFERNEVQRQKSQELGVYIILKGANTCITTPQGECYFNSTGNPGMGTAGSGDVLTGILAGLLAQGYTELQSCLLGVFLHGLAGDLAAQALSQEALMAGDILDYMGKAFLALHAAQG